MKTAILVQAHKNPGQVARLCKRLEHPDVDVYLNIDAKVDIESYKALIANVNYIKQRTNIKWGRFSLIDGPLKALKEIMTAPVKYDYIHLISGQDYPLVSMNTILEELSMNPGAEYYFSTPTDQEGPRWEMIRKRHIRHHWRYRSKPAIVTRPVNAVFKLPFLKRKPPMGMKMFFGSAWWTLSSQCIEYIMDFCEKNPKYVRFFRTTFCGDEFFFQTIIENTELALRPNLWDKRYIDWTAGGPHPKTLKVEDYNKLIESKTWFGRKFDETIDSEILDMLDEHIAKDSKRK